MSEGDRVLAEEGGRLGKDPISTENGNLRATVVELELQARTHREKVLGWAAVILLLTLVGIVGVVVFDLRSRDIGRSEIMEEVVCQGEISNEGMAGIADFLESLAENPNRPLTDGQKAALERLRRNGERAEAADKKCNR